MNLDPDPAVDRASAASDPHAKGVFAADPSGRRRLVHLYQGGDYGLRGVFELFGLGEPGPPAPDKVSLSLTLKEIAELKVMADAYSFDHDEGFIEMCLDLYRFATRSPRDRHGFEANF